MSSDPNAFKRATVVSLFGLAIQAALALTVLIYALIGRDHAGVTAAIYLGLGVPVWFGLALVFHQHRLAAIEAIEEEMLLAGGAAEASVFQEAAGELRVAARKAEWMHRVLLPGLSLAVAGALLVIGWLRYSAGLEFLKPDGFLAPGLTGWAVTIGLVIAAVGFVFARFCAGMAQQEVWSNLRAGATWAVGAAVVGLLMAVAHGVAFATTDAILRRLPVILPVLMMALGAEIILNFILSVYRPRVPGEFPRPAFDSRVLAFIAAPDRLAESISEAINYQFGLDVSSTWFYQLLSRSLAFLLLVGGLVVWLLTAVAVVGPDEKGLVLRSGRLVRAVDSTVTGKLPWPFERVETYPAENMVTLNLGSFPHHAENRDPILWTEPHGVDETYFLVRASSAGADAARLDDMALVSAEIPLKYVVEDMIAYQLLAADGETERDRHRQDLLGNLARRTVMEVLARFSVDEVLGGDRDRINRALRRQIEAQFAGLNRDPETGVARGSGVRIVFVGVVGAHPPFRSEVGASFEAVVNADQRRLAAEENAGARAIQTLASVAGEVDLARRIVQELDELERLTASGADAQAVARQRIEIERLIDQAGGEAAGLLLAARADRWTRHMDYRGRAARQEGRLALYNAAPEVYLAGLYLDALREAVADSRLFITTVDSPSVRLTLEQAPDTLEGILNETRQEN
ncbi:MAG: hypothetical protein D6693_01115 [Planctomycetota bacterium]|nr:MAG: hypothetical protein D6693_01115 [Planctomycetota bacterium]